MGTIKPLGEYVPADGEVQLSPDDEIDWQALITDEVRADFRRDGVVFLPSALHAEWLNLVEMAYLQVMRNTDTMARFFKGQPQEFLESVHNYPNVPEIRQLLADSPIADMIGSLINSENVWYFLDEFFLKEGGNRGPTPWHQDLPYWPLAGEQFASMWITLDPLPKDECLEFVRGSHRQTVYDGFLPSDVNNSMRKPYYGGELPQLPDIDANRDEWDIVSWPIEPGDVILLHPGLLHGGGHTGADTRRRTLTVRCYGDDVVYAQRPTNMPSAPRRPGLGLKLRPGDPLRHSSMPRLRPASDALD
ncbi:MAG: phytanoyl-CoA dioxygenase family protein [Pseudomonadaceae bacterium]|nr:phytanoyl-CoA dioxygenase family protein [Pseudomonadaceae bacterium]